MLQAPPTWNSQSNVWCEHYHSESLVPLAISRLTIGVITLALTEVDHIFW